MHFAFSKITPIKLADSAIESGLKVVYLWLGYMMAENDRAGDYINFKKTYFCLYSDSSDSDSYSYSDSDGES